MNRILLSCLAVFLVPIIANAQDPVFSGPQLGEKLTPFRVQSWPKSKEATLIPKDHKGPAMVIFVHEITRPGLALIRPVDHYAGKLAKAGLTSHIVWLTEDKSKTEAFFNRAKGTLKKLKSPISISLDGQEGPGNYGLNRKVTLTVLLAKDRKTVANFALIQPSDQADGPKIIAALAKLMNKDKAPKLALLYKELGINRRKPAKKNQTPRELGILMRQLIQKTNTEADVKKTIQQIAKWAGKDRRKLAHVRRIGNIIIQQGYGTEAAQTAIKKLIEKK